MLATCSAQRDTNYLLVTCRDLPQMMERESFFFSFRFLFFFFKEKKLHFTVIVDTMKSMISGSNYDYPILTWKKKETKIKLNFKCWSFDLFSQFFFTLFVKQTSTTIYMLNLDFFPSFLSLLSFLICPLRKNTSGKC